MKRSENGLIEGPCILPLNQLVFFGGGGGGGAQVSGLVGLQSLISSAKQRKLAEKMPLKKILSNF